MSIFSVMLVCVCGLLSTTTVAQTSGWRGIVPLHSTRQDVEALIGPPVTPHGITYDLKSERVNVVYSDGNCRNANVEWNVTVGTVLGINIYPQTKVMLRDLKIDLGRFEKSINMHNGDLIVYGNEEKGIAISATSNSQVISIQYFPRAKDGQLRCPGFSRRSLSNAELQYYKFDEYSGLTLADERARLDNFARRLRREPQSKGYILAYTIRGTRSSEALARANRARGYLIKNWRIDGRRLEIRFAGRRTNTSFQLFIVR